LVQLDGSGIRLNAEFTVASLRPDVVVLKAGSQLVGYCEVKRPGLGADPARPLQDGNVLGQVYDYAMELRHQHGVQWAFVLVTTFTHWRAVWLDDTACQYAAALDVVDNGTIAASPHLPQASSKRRVCCVSDVVAGEGNPQVGTFLGSVLLKWGRSPIAWVGDARRLWPWLSADGIVWRKFDVARTSAAFPADPRPPFARLRELGSGRDGTCWEVGKGTARYVMKIVRRADGATQEAARWQRLWGVAAQAVEVMGRGALVMPLVHMFENEDEFRAMAAPAERAVRHIAAQRLIHNDLRHSDGRVKWEHFGVLTQADGSSRVVIVDLSDVSEASSEEEAVSTMSIAQLFAVT
jgi:hypothetical protein